MCAYNEKYFTNYVGKVTDVARMWGRKPIQGSGQTMKALTKLFLVVQLV